MKIFLIRHAKSFDAKNELTQYDDTPIIIDSETKSQIEQIKKQIPQPDSIFCSPLKRAKETADLLFGQDNYKILDYIYEYKTPKEIIGKPRSVAINYWENQHKHDKMDIAWEPDGGESFTSIANRVNRLYEHLLTEKHLNDRKIIAIVGHGIFFRHLLLKISNIPWTEYPQLIFDVLRKLKWDNLQVVEVEI